MKVQRSVLAIVKVLAGLAVFASVREAAAACNAATPTNICVGHNGAVFTVDVGQGRTAKGTLAMTRGTPYVFELDPADSAVLASHPFYLTDSSTGAGAGTQYSAPAVAGSVNFTPGPQTPNTLYYQCNVHSNMGAMIAVSGGNVVPGDDGGIDAGLDFDGGGGIQDSGVGSSSGTSGGSSSGTSGSGASSSSGGATTSSSSGSGGGTVPVKDDGCAVGVVGASGSGAGLLIAAGAVVLARRRRR